MERALELFAKEQYIFAVQSCMVRLRSVFRSPGTFPLSPENRLDIKFSSSQKLERSAQRNNKKQKKLVFLYLFT